MDKIEEILIIAQEECAELIQEISKIRRFGLESTHRDGQSHRLKLTQEAGDVLAMIELMKSHELFTDAELQAATEAKFHKLKTWSRIYEQN
jgi:hypothetical protein